MEWKRAIQPIVTKIPLSKEGDDIEDWLKVSFEDKMESLERMRKYYIEMQGDNYPERMDKSVFSLRRKLYGAISH